VEAHWAMRRRDVTCQMPKSLRIWNSRRDVLADVINFQTKHAYRTLPRKIFINPEVYLMMYNKTKTQWKCKGAQL
jgi:hypothetical protein